MLLNVFQSFRVNQSSNTDDTMSDHHLRSHKSADHMLHVHLVTRVNKR